MQEPPAPASSATTGQSKIATKISYCPHLDIYHYTRADGSDYMFDTAQLEKSVETYAKEGNTREAEFMAVLTGLARRYPHQVVAFDESGQAHLGELVPAKHPDGPSSD